MKKFLGVMALTLSICLVAAGCSTKPENPKAEPGKDTPPPATTVELKDVLTKVKEQIAKDFKDSGAGDILVDGKLQGFMEVDLTDAEDPASSVFLEKMDIKGTDMKNGFVLAPQANIKSDEIILLEANDEAQVATLKTALDNEKKSQEQTWKRYLPEQYEKVEKNIIKTAGNYLIYVTYDEPGKMIEVFDSSTK